MWNGNWKWADEQEFNDFINQYDGELVKETIDGEEFYHDYSISSGEWDSVVAQKTHAYFGDEFLYKVYHDYEQDMAEYLERLA